MPTRRTQDLRALVAFDARRGGATFEAIAGRLDLSIAGAWHACKRGA